MSRTGTQHTAPKGRLILTTSKLLFCKLKANQVAGIWKSSKMP